MGDAALLEISGVRKSFGGVRALSDGALSLYPGRITALIGENGAGKSSLVKILSGVHAPDAGEIRLGGQEVRFSDPRAALRHGVCAVHQEPTIFSNLSVAENIFAADPLLRGGLMDWKAMRQRASELLAMLETPIDPTARAGDLSVGQRQMVQIARGLAHEARVLILDEPTAALSHREAEDLFRVVRRLRDQNHALLFISHRFEEVFALCDRFAVFRDGAAVGEGEVADATPDGLISLMVGRDLDHLYPPRQGAVGKKRLRVEGLSRRQEFEDVTLSAHAGEVLGVYGLVGSGRSEMAKALFGLGRPDRGLVLVDGEAVAFASPQDAIEGGLAYVPEDRQREGAILSLPIQDNIVLSSLNRFSRFGFVDRRGESQAAEDLSSRLRIKQPGLSAPVAALSGGNQQKVVLAKWLATNPKVLILDEPTKGVDVGAKAAVHAAVRQLAEQGLAVVMISSDLPEIVGMSDRIMVMRRGRVRGELDRDHATPDAVMRLAADA